MNGSNLKENVGTRVMADKTIHAGTLTVTSYTGDSGTSAFYLLAIAYYQTHAK